MGNDLLDGMLIFQILAFLALLLAWPVFAVLRLRRRADQ